MPLTFSTFSIDKRFVEVNTLSAHNLLHLRIVYAILSPESTRARYLGPGRVVHPNMLEEIMKTHQLFYISSFGLVRSVPLF